MEVFSFHGMSPLLKGGYVVRLGVTHVSEHLLPMSPVHTPAAHPNLPHVVERDCRRYRALYVVAARNHPHAEQQADIGGPVVFDRRRVADRVAAPEALAHP